MYTDVDVDVDVCTGAGYVPLCQWRNYNFCLPPGKHSLRANSLDTSGHFGLPLPFWAPGPPALPELPTAITPLYVYYCTCRRSTVTLVMFGPVWARGRCRISPPRFPAECCKRQLNQGSFVLLYFRLSTFSDLY